MISKALQIDRATVLPKVLYLTLFFSLGSLASYIAIFYSTTLKYSASQIGYLFAVAPFINFIACPFWAAIADRTGLHSIFLILCTLMSTGFTMLICIAKPSYEVVLCLVIAASIFGAGLGPLLDVIVLERLIPQKDLYGKQRLWGALAVGIAGPFMIILVGLVGLDGIFWSLLFWALVFCVIVGVKVKDKKKGYERMDAEQDAAVCIKKKEGYECITVENVSKVCVKDEVTEQIKPIPIPTLPFKTRLRCLFSPSYTLFLASAFLFGVAGSIISTYEYLFLAEHMQAPNMLLGCIPPFAVAMELPFFFFSKPILNRVGPKNMILFAQLTNTIRVLAYILMFITKSSAWWVLPIDLLHGTSFAFFWTTAVHLANTNSPEGLQATSQGLLSGVFGGLGAGIGSIVGGFLYASGPLIMWLTCAGILVSSFLFFPFGVTVLERLYGKPKALADFNHGAEQMRQVVKTVSFMSMDGSLAAVIENLEARSH